MKLKIVIQLLNWVSGGRSEAREVNPHLSWQEVKMMYKSDKSRTTRKV